MTQPQSFLDQHSAIDDLTPQQVDAINDLMERYAKMRSNEQSNLLRSILEEAAVRLRSGAPREEIAEQLTDAADASLQELLDQNVEIEIDNEIPESPSRPQIHGDPILASLYHATRLRDGMAAIQIAGETPSDARKEEFRSALISLRDTLNNHL